MLFGDWLSDPLCAFAALLSESLGVFVNGFCVSLVRPGVLIFLALVLFFRLGAGIGLPLLFWRPKAVLPTPAGSAPTAGRTRPAPIPQLLVGVGVGALIWQVLLGGYLFEEFATNYTVDRPPFCEVRPPYTPDKTITLTAHIPQEVADNTEINGNTFAGRFRYDPRSVGAMWRYVGEVAIGFLAFGGLALVFAYVYREVRRQYFAWIEWVPYAVTTRATPVPYSVWLPIGMAAGALALSGCTWVWCEGGGRQTGADVGAAAIRFAGWGDVDRRQELLRASYDRPEDPRPKADGKAEAPGGEGKAKTDERPDPEAVGKKAKANAQRRYAPYYPVYGAFALNFALIFVASIVLMVLPERLSFFSPAVGVVLLLNVLLFAHVFLNYFFVCAAEFGVLILAGLVFAAGRAYKLRFPHLEEYYARPVRLADLYAAQAAKNANDADSGSVPFPPPLPPPPPPLNPPPATVPVVSLTDSRAINFPHRDVKSATKPLPPLVIVCVSGGGSRAAAWTMKVLLEIERAFGNPDGSGPNPFVWGPNVPRPLQRDRSLVPVLDASGGTQPVTEKVAFPYHVRLVSGASGGMFAAAHYVASLDAPTAGSTAVNRNKPFTRDRNQKRVFGGSPLTPEELFDGVCGDFLTPVVHTMVSRDLLSALLPFHTSPSGIDRGARIEEAWKVALSGQLDQTFGELYCDGQAEWRPSMVFSPMLVEDGRQLFISNLELGEVVRNRAHILGEDWNPPGAPPHRSGVAGDLNPPDARDGRRLLSREGIEFFKVFPGAHRFRVGTAARMSASFPYVFPAVPLPTNPPRRVVDAGYYDNYGVGIASSWLANHLEWVAANTSGVVVVQIRDGASGESRRRECVFDAFPTVPDAGTQWATSPPVGLWQFRVASHAFRNDNLLHQLDRLVRDYRTAAGKALDPLFFTTASFELQRGDDVALNFTLTEGERGVILNAVAEDGFKRQVAALLEWWHSR